MFVDYSRVQAADAVSVAKNEIGKVLDLTFIDAAAATAGLNQTPTLVILDNLEALAPDSLRALLEAAVPWSEAGGSRVLCTTRRPDFGHAASGSKARTSTCASRLTASAEGGAQRDALEWCAALMNLPPAPTVSAPKREALIELFDRVKFHPLSIRVLSQQLKTRRIGGTGGEAGAVAGERRRLACRRRRRADGFQNTDLTRHGKSVGRGDPAGRGLGGHVRSPRRTRPPGCWPRSSSRSTNWTRPLARCCRDWACFRAGRLKTIFA